MSYVLEHFLEKLPEEWIRMSHKKKKAIRRAFDII